ncbi:histidine kinase response regulator hybrid protein [Flavobacteria bacterium BAL38]|nr:histidine kinase response regulator hybrid protein [Flavobacteria bacterium BAL38]
MLGEEKLQNILLIEDNEGDFFLFEEYLNEKIPNTKIKHVKRFQELKNLNASFDFVFLDLSLPDKSGIELLEAVLQLFTKTPVIVLSGYEEEFIKEKALSIGAANYLFKDQLNSEVLFEVISQSNR